MRMIGWIGVGVVVALVALGRMSNTGDGNSPSWSEVSTQLEQQHADFLRDPAHRKAMQAAIDAVNREQPSLGDAALWNEAYRRATAATRLAEFDPFAQPKPVAGEMTDTDVAGAAQPHRNFFAEDQPRPNFFDQPQQYALSPENEAAIARYNQDSARRLDQNRAAVEAAWQARLNDSELVSQVRRQESIAQAESQQRSTYNTYIAQSRSRYEDDEPLTQYAQPQPEIRYQSYDGRDMSRAIDVGNGYVKDRDTGVVRPTIDVGNGLRQEVRRPIDAYNDVGRALDND